MTEDPVFVYAFAADPIYRPITSIGEIEVFVDVFFSKDELTFFVMKIDIFEEKADVFQVSTHSLKHPHLYHFKIRIHIITHFVKFLLLLLQNKSELQSHRNCDNFF